MGNPPELFIVSTGVSGNLGDAVIRRRVLRWFETGSTRHVYVGRTTPGWVEQLELPTTDVVYGAGERRAWLKKLLFGRGRRVLVFDPGEVPLGREHLKSELVFLLIGIVLRLRGASVVRPPRAVAHVDRPTAWLHQMGCLLSQTVMWRDADSHRTMRCGDLTPDTAFGEPRRAQADEPHRVAISLRGARPLPPDAWFDAVAEFARASGLLITLSTQVDEDRDRSAELAARFRALGATVDHVEWTDASDLEHERRLRDLYTECKVVISDRLHVLLIAAKCGAIPTEVVPGPKSKCRTHFATAGIHDISLDVAGLPAEEIVAFLGAAAARGPEITALVDAAEARLNAYVEGSRRRALRSPAAASSVA
ncbi:polysaccharide pyruvyl transferase family protein [Nocardioides zeae]|uniref:Polysaccharide pyruvyl transferase family protein n=1 Tax=Nocardioides zeae TaxID=1457234 RepID=A0A6P0HMX6_9ACTN|nr:polysaccharide pyruvyl transferase family protein [Nocardioides zeae]NEN79973.1 polysaccharide pyruvyl transferase family protein [Nocardioides zeae]